MLQNKWADSFFCLQTVEEETQKAREDVKRAIKQRAKHSAVPVSDEGRVEGDFDAMFGAGAPSSSASAAAAAPRQAEAASPSRKAVAGVHVHVERSASAHRLQPGASDRSLSAKRSGIQQQQQQQQQRPSSAKSSVKAAATSSVSARPVSAPASARVAPASDDLGLDASSPAPGEPPASASQVVLNCIFSRVVAKPLSHARALCSPQLAQARLRELKKKKLEEDAKAKAEQQVRCGGGGGGSSGNMHM
jgi:hypothetical protein